ncbi:MAG: type II toxin-antitoxin system HicB family antitoxin [Gammaproteobacteria bacterium]|nr:type II toxin-antitoxin system HicB family antitoxin [Gammaproteobacteria bacterium]
MNGTMSYKGYAARVEYSDEDDCFIGHIDGINDIAGFHGISVPELKEAFRESVDDYIESCAKTGKVPQKPYSGKLMLYITPKIHTLVAIAAQVNGKSINQWASETLEREACSGHGLPG